MKETDPETLNVFRRLVQDASCYQHMIEVKDESIVKLTNQLHEVELAAKIEQASPPVQPKAGFFYTEKVGPVQ